MSTTQQLPTLSPGRERLNKLPGTKRVGIGYALVHNCSFEEALSSITAHAASNGQPAFVVTPNAQHVVLLEKEARLRQIYRNADLVIPDGFSLLLASRVFGRSLRERVAGVDMLEAICRRAAENGIRVFFLGGRPGVDGNPGSADLAAATLRNRYPGLHVDTYCPPIGFDKSDTELAKIATAIRAARPQIAFVGFGAPKQEYWIDEHGLQLGINVCLGIGGSFEMVAGILKRAPVWMQRSGCEWVYRLYKEPRRMWKRYLIGNLQFAQIVLSQCVRKAMLSTLVDLIRRPSFEPERYDAEMREKLLFSLPMTVPNHTDQEPHRA